MPLFSIIIPVYNSEPFLAEAMQSVLGQNFKNLEIILVNDCSTDKSGEMCNSFRRQKEGIQVIHNEKNSGARGTHDGLLSFKNLITEKTISLIEGMEDRQLYVFCADLFGKVTAQILKFVIICHQRKEIFESIASQLEKIGLKREQLVRQCIQA